MTHLKQALAVAFLLVLAVTTVLAQENQPLKTTITVQDLTTGRLEVRQIRGRRQNLLQLSRSDRPVLDQGIGSRSREPAPVRVRVAPFQRKLLAPMFLRAVPSASQDGKGAGRVGFEAERHRSAGMARHVSVEGRAESGADPIRDRPVRAGRGHHRDRSAERPLQDMAAAVDGQVDQKGRLPAVGAVRRRGFCSVLRRWASAWIWTGRSCLPPARAGW